MEKGKTVKTPTFQEFWDAYGLKRDKVGAERAWNRLKAADRAAAVAGIAAYSDDCMARGIRKMYGQGYLSHRRWEDEPEQDAAMAAQAAHRPSPRRPDTVRIPVEGTFDGMDTW